MSNQGFVYLDFKRKIAYFATSKKSGYDVPATETERKAFLTHFYQKGKKECTFSELKAFVNFHGTRIKGRVYATVQITEPFIYQHLLSKNEDMQIAIEKYIWDVIAKRRDSEVKIKSKVAAKHILKAFVKSLEDEIDKMLEL
jgi:hypothetical protein